MLQITTISCARCVQFILRSTENDAPEPLATRPKLSLRLLDSPKHLPEIAKSLLFLQKLLNTVNDQRQGLSLLI